MVNHVQGKQFGRAVNNALVLNSDHALGRATIKVLDHQRVAIETLHATVKPGETRVAIKDKRIDGVFVDAGRLPRLRGRRRQWRDPRGARPRPSDSRACRLPPGPLPRSAQRKRAKAAQSRLAPRLFYKFFQI
jgi:hypothetical protein